jgi:hypothetical protein
MDDFFGRLAERLQDRDRGRLRPNLLTRFGPVPETTWDALGPGEPEQAAVGAPVDEDGGLDGR